MRKLSFIAVILLTTTLFSCKKESASSPSNNTNSNWSINGADYSINPKYNSLTNLVGFWSATDNMAPNSLQVLAPNISYDSSNANKTINLYTHDGNSFCLGVQFKNRPTTNKVYTISSVIPSYTQQVNDDIENENATDSTCMIIGSLFSDFDNYWFSYKPTDKVTVTVNNGKITASFSNISLVYYAVNGDGSTNYTTVSGTLIEGK